MTLEFLTLDDMETTGKTVFLRVDINSPLDPVSKRILDDSRIKATIETLNDLEDAKVVFPEPGGPAIKIPSALSLNRSLNLSERW